MATLTSPLRRKIKKVLSGHFPAPDTVKLMGKNGIIGVVTSTRFQGMDAMDRQDLIEKYLAPHLSREEQHGVQIIVAVTPDEETGYRAGY